MSAAASPLTATQSKDGEPAGTSFLFCVIFRQLTSRFILLETARQEFADGVLEHK